MRVWISPRRLVITIGVIDIDLGNRGSSIVCRLDLSGISTIKLITSESLILPVDETLMIVLKIHHQKLSKDTNLISSILI